MNTTIERLIYQITQEQLTAQAAADHEKEVEQQIFRLTHELESYARQILLEHGTIPNNSRSDHVRETAKIPYTMNDGRKITFQLVGADISPHPSTQRQFPTVEILKQEGEQEDVIFSIILQEAMWQDGSDMKEIGQFDAMRAVLTHIEKSYQLGEVSAEV